MRVELFLLPMILLAGCAAPGDALDAASIDDETAAEPDAWTASAEGAIGWVAAAGTGVFVGDLIVGAQSHDQCPRLMWYVPEGTTSLALDVGAGTGPSQLALSDPGGIAFHDQPDGAAIRFDVEGPAPGIWELELRPRGAAAPQTRVVSLSLEGAGEAPDLVLQADGDCLL